MVGNVHERGDSLEDQFFHEQDKKLIAKLAELSRTASAKEALSHVSGIRDDKVLERLVELGTTPEELVAMAVLPLVEVAWADGDVSPKERQAVLEAARSLHGGEEPIAPELLESWLARKPDAKLQSSWQLYVQGLCNSLQPQEREHLRDEVLGHARRVAEASGGILGLGSKVSAAEEKVLERLKKAFSV